MTRSPKRPGRKASKKRAAREPEQPVAGTPSDVLELFRTAQSPLKWPQVRGLAGAHRGPDADRLRRLLRGLVHGGELHLDGAGAYHLTEHIAGVEGVLERVGRDQFDLRVAGSDEVWPVRLSRRSRLRSGDQVTARLVDEQAVVVEVSARSPQPLVGRLVAGRRGWYVISESPDYRGRVSLATDGHGKASDGDSVAVRIVGEDSYGLIGAVERVVARRDDLHVASETLLAAFEVPTEWPDEVEDALRRLPDQVDPESYQDRVDLSAMPLVTIDGETAQDFDDAVYCEPRPRGAWRLVVAIADVSSYVQPGDPLDVNAVQRGNSVYLPDRVVPMLPEALSNDLCSLRPEVPRLAMVCDMQISATGKLTKHEFYPALIRSWARLTYSRVAAFLEGDRSGLADAVVTSLDALYGVYGSLRRARDERGALDFDSAELNLILENGLLERIEPVQRNDAHRLIEEAMIAANISTAQFLEKHQRAGLYRIHAGPTAEKFDMLREALAAAGIRLSDTPLTPSGLKKVVDTFAGRPDRRLLETLILRSMSQAVYSPNNSGHFGLGLKRYMHFTSPIRRYADLVVHRAIKSIIEARPFDAQNLNEVGTHISSTERRAEDVERAVGDWLKCEYASQFVGQCFNGRVIGVTDFGLFIELEDIYVQGLLHISNLGRDYFQLSSSATSLVGEGSGLRYTLGQELEVLLADVDVEARKMDLLLPERRGKGRNRNSSRRGRKAGG